MQLTTTEKKNLFFFLSKKTYFFPYSFLTGNLTEDNSGERKERRILQSQRLVIFLFPVDVYINKFKCKKSKPKEHEIFNVSESTYMFFMIYVSTVVWVPTENTSRWKHRYFDMSSHSYTHIGIHNSLKLSEVTLVVFGCFFLVPFDVSMYVSTSIFQTSPP